MNKSPAPKWIERIVQITAQNIRPQTIMGPLGWKWSEPESADHPWEVSIYPTPGEIYSGPHDGERVNPAYLWNLSAVIRMFDSAPQMMWAMPAVRHDNYVGSELVVLGVINKVPVWLRLFNNPPSDEKPTLMIDPSRNKVWNPNQPQNKKNKKKKRDK